MKWRVLVRKISRGSHIKSRVIETIAADQNNFFWPEQWGAIICVQQNEFADSAPHNPECWKPPGFPDCW